MSVRINARSAGTVVTTTDGTSPVGGTVTLNISSEGRFVEGKFVTSTLPGVDPNRTVPASSTMARILTRAFVGKVTGTVSAHVTEHKPAVNRTVTSVRRVTQPSI